LRRIDVLRKSEIAISPQDIEQKIPFSRTWVFLHIKVPLEMTISGQVKIFPEEEPFFPNYG
jgi:hypothetical protein